MNDARDRATNEARDRATNEPVDQLARPTDLFEPAVPEPAAPAAGTAGTDAPDQAIRLAEALVFASASPVAETRLAAILGPDGPDPRAVFRALAARSRGRGVELIEAAGGWMFRTAPDLAPRLAIVVTRPRRLPRAVMETLAVVAMHQPCTRAEIEARRGVTLAQNVLETLLEHGLVRAAGRREVPGRPTLWATTDDFLIRFGLPSLDHLPRRDDLLADLPAPASVPGAPPATDDAGNSVAPAAVLEERHGDAPP